MTAEEKMAAREHGKAASTLLERLSSADPEANRRLSEITRHLVLMRDALIDEQRAGHDCAEQLGQTNAIISSIFGLEFPAAGLQWARVCESRDGLRRLLDAHW